MRWVTLRAVALAAAFLLPAASACNPAGDSARGIAESFLDRHYIEIDLAGTRRLCDGLACAKLDKEIALTETIAIGEDTQKPHVNYRLAYSQERDEMASYEYELQIAPPGSAPFPKRVLLTLRRNAEGWKVTNYGESDPHPSAGE